MDWKMVSNATGSLQRLHTLAYLLMDRYEFDAEYAGRSLAKNKHDHEIRNNTICELRVFLSDTNTDLAYASYKTDNEVRSYLTKFIEALDNALRIND